MSKTPRTDALLNTTYIGDGTHFVELARQLEAENAELREALQLAVDLFGTPHGVFTKRARALLAKEPK